MVRHGFQLFLKDMGRLYLENPALWEWDYDTRGFSWIDCQDWQQSVISYIRSAPRTYLVCILNFTPVVRHGYRVGVPEAGWYRERINSDSGLYGGSDVGNAGLVETEPTPFHGYAQSLSLTLPPLGCLILEPEGDRPK
jgi:1,4-alpha-glucan branching enzyme